MQGLSFAGTLEQNCTGGVSSVGGTPPQAAGISRKPGQTMQQVEGKAVQMLDTWQSSCSRNKMQLI